MAQGWIISDAAIYIPTFYIMVNNDAVCSLKGGTVSPFQTVKPVACKPNHLITTVINQDTMWPLRIELLSNLPPWQTPTTLRPWRLKADGEVMRKTRKP